MAFIKEHIKGIAVACGGVILVAAVIIGSSLFILDSKEKMTASAELSMEGADDQHIQVSGFTRDDGNLSLSFTGNVELFGGVRGSAQGTMEQMGSAAGGRLIKMADPHYDRTIYLRAAHYTTYVIMPEQEGTPFGVWAVAVVDDQEGEPTVLFWMDLREDGTVVLDRTDGIGPGVDWQASVGSTWAEELSWEQDAEGAFTFSDAQGRTFRFVAQFF